MKPASARGSNGNSRRISRALPVSMYFVFSSGSVVSWKCAQCGQVIEAYSTMVTGASALPSTLSGSAPGSSSLAMSTVPGDFGRLDRGGRRCVSAAPGSAGAAGVSALAWSPESLQAASTRRRRHGDQRREDGSAGQGTDHANHLIVD